MSIITHLHLFDTKAAHDAEYTYKNENYVKHWVGNVKGSREVSYDLPPRDYSREYLAFTALTSGTFSLSIPSNVDTTCITSVSYSLDDGETWTTTSNTSNAVTITTPTVQTGGTVLWKGNGSTFGKTTDAGFYAYFSTTGDFAASGNVMSLLYGDNFIGETTLTEDCAFVRLFYGLPKLKDVSNLSLAATTLSPRCYYDMFYGCTSLTTAPALPATTLAESCYYQMFYDCTNLSAAPVLPALTMASSCYSYMFQGCSRLTTAPVLPGETLAYRCYRGMFKNCKALTAAPALPVTTLANACYDNMFNGCSSLTSTPTLNATTLITDCYNSMFKDCTSLTTPPVLPAGKMVYRCYRGMFQGCTALTTSPSLPATTMVNACYNSMFYDTNLLPDCSHINFNSVVANGLKGLFAGTKVTYNDLMTILPKDANNKPCLPATTLANYCYDSMFKDCKFLTSTPELPATTLANYCYNSMFQGCTALTTAPVLNATTMMEACYCNMFYGCTALTTAPDLPATTLVKRCYQYMFYECSNLNSIKAMFTTTPSSTYTYNWVYRVAASGTFTKNSAAEWHLAGSNGVPSGWTVQTASE